MRGAVVIAMLWPAAALGCKCQLTNSACRETAASEVIFIGTVEAIEPSFLDPWSPAQASSMALLNREYEQASDFTRLRDAYLKVFPDLPAGHKKRLQGAASKDDLSKLFYWILDHGKRVRLRVKTMYRNGDDPVDDDDEVPETIEVWTAFGDCGFHFQVGETYLVYGDNDEESDVVTTDACSRTRRLSEAGEDLAYLYYWKNFGEAASRLEGFVTTDPLYLRNRDAAHYSDRIDAAAPRVVLQLKNDAGAHYAESDEHGRFLFDGLPEGKYTVTGFAPGYPTEKRPVTAPKEVEIVKRACAAEVLVVTDTGPPR